MKSLPFTIKICGVTTPADAEMAARAGADAIGLNFYPRSKRFVTHEQARQIASAIPRGVAKVGVFVNTSLDEITAAISAASLDMLQLHGDEPPEVLAQIQDSHPTTIMRAFRWGSDGGKPIDDYLARCSSIPSRPQVLLIDSQTEGQFGGTGATADWGMIFRWQQNRASTMPLVLAGGLTPANVVEAIRTAQPDAVDTASGVESSPGHKDAALVKAFVETARGALLQRHRRS